MGGKELLLTRRMNPQLWTQALGTSLAISTFFVLRQRWGLRWVRPLSLFIVSFTYAISVGHRRELLKRQRGELAIKRLNARLEHRVTEQTAELQLANQTLAREAAERIESQRRLAASSITPTRSFR